MANFLSSMVSGAFPLLCALVSLTAFSNSCRYDWESRVVYYKGDVELTDLSPSDTGVYTCEVNYFQDGATDNLTLGVYSVQVTTETPTNIVYDQEPFSLDCHSHQLGLLFPSCTRQWLHNGSLVTAPGMTLAYNTSDDVINSVKKSMEGIWECQVMHSKTDRIWKTAWYYLSVEDAPSRVARWYRSMTQNLGVVVIVVTIVVVILCIAFLYSAHKEKDTEVEAEKSFVGVRTGWEKVLGQQLGKTKVSVQGLQEFPLGYASADKKDNKQREQGDTDSGTRETISSDSVETSDGASTDENDITVESGMESEEKSIRDSSDAEDMSGDEETDDTPSEDREKNQSGHGYNGRIADRASRSPSDDDNVEMIEGRTSDDEENEIHRDLNNASRFIFQDVIFTGDVNTNALVDSHFIPVPVHMDKQRPDLETQGKKQSSATYPQYSSSNNSHPLAQRAHLGYPIQKRHPVGLDVLPAAKIGIPVPKGAPSRMTAWDAIEWLAKHSSKAEALGSKPPAMHLHTKYVTQPLPHADSLDSLTRQGTSAKTKKRSRKDRPRGRKRSASRPSRTDLTSEWIQLQEVGGACAIGGFENVYNSDPMTEDKFGDMPGGTLIEGRQRAIDKDYTPEWLHLQKLGDARSLGKDKDCNNTNTIRPPRRYGFDTSYVDDACVVVNDSTKEWLHLKDLTNLSTNCSLKNADDYYTNDIRSSRNIIMPDETFEKSQARHHDAPVKTFERCHPLDKRATTNSSYFKGRCRRELSFLSPESVSCEKEEDRCQIQSQRYIKMNSNPILADPSFDVDRKLCVKHEYASPSFRRNERGRSFHPERISLRLTSRIQKWWSDRRQGLTTERNGLRYQKLLQVDSHFV